MAQWRVTMTLGDGAVDSSWGWPVTATGWLSPTKSIIESPPDGDAGDALLFVDGIGDQEGNLIEAQGLGEVIEFDPFWHCIPDEACSTEAIVGLTWPDGREGSAIEAGWDLDLRVIGVDGRSVPVTVEVEPAPAYGMLNGSTSGSLVWNEQSTPTFRYLASAPNPAKDEGNLDDFRVPSYAVWQATMRSTGSSTVPADFGVNFGSFGSDGYSRRIRIEDGQVQGGSLAMTQCPFSRFAECRIEAELGAGFSGDELPSGWEITIDWELELGVGTPDPAGGTLQILDVTNATPAPVP
jgi:hypothetical protein